MSCMVGRGRAADRPGAAAAVTGFERTLSATAASRPSSVHVAVCDSHAYACRCGGVGWIQEVEAGCMPMARRLLVGWDQQLEPTHLRRRSPEPVAPADAGRLQQRLLRGLDVAARGRHGCLLAGYALGVLLE